MIRLTQQTTLDNRYAHMFNEMRIGNSKLYGHKFIIIINAFNMRNALFNNACDHDSNTNLVSIHNLFSFVDEFGKVIEVSIYSDGRCDEGYLVHSKKCSSQTYINKLPICGNFGIIYNRILKLVKVKDCAISSV